MQTLAKPAIFQLKDIFQHPATLLGAMLLGGWIGTLFPGSAALLSALSLLYLSLIQMAALPFVILAVYFGLQRLPSEPGSGVRLARLAAMSLLAMLLCAVVGVLVASAAGAGSGMTAAQTAALGKLAMRSESQFTMALHDSGDGPAPLWDIGTLVPDNFFGVLAYGSLPSVLVGVLCFGAAVSVQDPQRSAQLSGIFEGMYRALESLVNRINGWLPVAAFVLAAAATASAGVEAIVLLGGFLGAFYAAVFAMCAAAIAVLCWKLKKSPWLVLLALREPITVCLFSPVAVAAVPGFIQGMSVKLGFSRGMVELVSPIAPVFIKAGEAMFFAVLAIYLANLYHHGLTAADIAWICALSWTAALWSVGIAGVKSVLLGGFVVASLGLPLEAVLPVFLLIEVLCEGPRNLLSFLISSALIALVADGLYINNEQDSEVWHPSTLKLVFTRKQALSVLFLWLIALFTVFCAGVGYGLRQAF
ncbi:cation:dicarboxylate symporter family transporter [Duganella violaceipulchra]|uniref:Dicarboxylate/amino acid:cation symporter n=1 Tax=Duganella violaceipulchra TaxID=2849652 RepID=A0AA41HE10_9BURK|nr:cation:dicarboxylase symporter family transporter [Duganella violaceicalia]MBV6324931.1 dicarboxylate/amino acid:cation symporter [Duganella violaceicalia]MCP2012320.1 Na+/H+-dicarboxylate symporter [Duganella violaceicalia]